MNSAQKILEMIEDVKPRDNKALDEIDARVFLFINYPDNDYRGYSKTQKTQFVFLSNDGTSACEHCSFPTRSRDALKSIRPNEFEYRSYYYADDGYAFALQKNQLIFNSLKTKWLSTEELAELHAIIQAIQWKRNHV